MSASKEKAGVAPAAGKGNRGAVAAELTDEHVREFLMNNGDFLQHNPDLLDHLHVSHASGSAVSLVEKQVSVLRERNVEMRHQLKGLTDNARENDKLYEQTRALVVKLLEAESIAGIYRSFMHAMQSNFDVEFASLILFGDEPGQIDYRVDSLEQARSQIGALLGGGKAVCGALRTEEFNYLFAPSGTSKHFSQGGSAAIMPLNDTTPMGVIAVGSSDASRYTRDMGVIFLSHIGEVILRLLPRFSRPGV